ncbi:MAG: hypothetical protein A3F84_26335 [Candidatus Handelsmanbacteria bacterium RIFCSPLOWO2_12_FULL_64_10]|uniref:Uncharacterized protein n=1 Tax=Handelsmanbacteria sp. (strain RIFCSPLOWO2_12_FULL_64_10) TaxID=1817868 RepID=A0A1F6CAL4_HANXR|nr:MAG: hypothetical protein A3F84_26335 [Candidatus Handelsmanbacteria bacterium RIFCSPLOWO2_12_FULL_64_10]
MKTLQGIYENGTVRLKENPGLSGRFPVYVLIPDPKRKTGIDPARNTRINQAKRTARKRLRNQKTERGS